jgi:uncharacterized protein (TIGR02246 family)
MNHIQRGTIMYGRLLLSLLSLTFLLTFTSCIDKEGDTVEEQAIRNQSKAYEQAFNQENAETIASLWAENAIYTDPQTGTRLEGREAIQKDFQETFQENTGDRIEIKISTIDILSDSKAVESGLATITNQGEEPLRSAYKAFYGKEKGEWLLTEVREIDYELPPSQYEHLKDLNWLVGEWVDEDEDAKIVKKIGWDDNQNFLTQHFTVSAEGQKIQEGRQIIAWDPVKERIRSWVFDSDGGFGEGTWSNEEKQWKVEMSYSLPDGRIASAINIYTPINENSYKWESTGREVAGEQLPSIEPVTVERKRG